MVANEPRRRRRRSPAPHFRSGSACSSLPYLPMAPGFAVSIVENGKIVLDQGYGLANISSMTPVSSSTSFDIASLSKTFTALGVMLLYQKSLSTSRPINLNAPISRYITKPIVFDDAPQSSAVLPAAWSKITVRQLLTMTSGIQGSAGPGNDPVATQLNLMPKTLLFTPGTKYFYSNVNFWLLASMIQQQNGRYFGKAQSYSDFITGRILKPLGMTETTLLAGSATTGPKSATPYTPFSTKNGWQEIPSTDLQEGQSLAGAGSITSTAHDMSLYVNALLNGRLLSRRTYRTFWDSVPVIGYSYGGAEADSGFATPGLGWDNATWTSRGPAVVEKNGSLIGFESQINLYPLTKDGIFISYNIGLNSESTQTFNQNEVILAVHQAMETAAIVGTVTGAVPPAGGWLVYVDTNNDGHDDGGDPSVMSSASDAFTLLDIPAGTWTVRIANLPQGDTASSATLTVAAGQAYLNTNLTVST